MKSDNIVKRNKQPPTTTPNKKPFVKPRNEKEMRKPMMRHVRKSIPINAMCDGKVKRDE
jgi:hypothetical protein